MDFRFSPEQEELASTVRRFLAAKAPETEVRRAMESKLGYNPALWSRMAVELGLPGLAIPEELGGAGFTFLELGIVLQETGRALLCAPLFSSVVLAANALLGCSDEAAAKDWLPQIATGELVATLALPHDLDVRATRGSGDHWTLDGTAGYVVDGAAAQLILLPVRTDQELSLFAVTGNASGLTRTPDDFFDPTRRLARLALAATPATLVGEVGAAGQVVTRSYDLAAIALAAESVGIAERCLEMATEYAKIREQFGQPIGSFQAIKHKLANVLLEVEAARSAAWYALWCAADRPDEVPVVAPLALSICSEAAYLAAAENIQIHGGIGYTWEHPAHLFFRRATVSRQLLGDPATQRELMLRRLGR